MPTHRQSLPRFGLRDLLISTALIAGGIAALKLVFTGGPWDTGWWLVPWFGGGALIGAGIGLPFGRAGRAILVGVAVQFVLLAAAALFGLPLIY